MEKITTLLLIFLLMSCNQSAKTEIECYGSPSEGYTVKTSDSEYFKWSDDAADTVKMKEDARLYLKRQ